MNNSKYKRFVYSNGEVIEREDVVEEVEPTNEVIPPESHREEMLSIIKLHRLGYKEVGHFSGIRENTARYLILNERPSHKRNAQLEDSVLAWRDKVYENRRRILALTPYAQCYRKPNDILMKM